MCTTEIQALQNKRRGGPRADKKERIKEQQNQRRNGEEVGYSDAQHLTNSNATALNITREFLTLRALLCRQKDEECFVIRRAYIKFVLEGGTFLFLIVRTYTNYVLEEERNSLTVSLKNVFFYEFIRIMFWKEGLAIKNVILSMLYY